MIGPEQIVNEANPPFDLEDVAFEHAIDTLMVYMEHRAKNEDIGVPWETIEKELDWLFTAECLEKLIFECMDRDYLTEPVLARLTTTD